MISRQSAPSPNPLDRAIAKFNMGRFPAAAEELDACAELVIRGKRPSPGDLAANDPRPCLILLEQLSAGQASAQMTLGKALRSRHFVRPENYEPERGRALIETCARRGHKPAQRFYGQILWNEAGSSDVNARVDAAAWIMASGDGAAKPCLRELPADRVQEAYTKGREIARNTAPKAAAKKRKLGSVPRRKSPAAVGSDLP